MRQTLPVFHCSLSEPTAILKTNLRRIKTLLGRTEADGLNYELENKSTFKHAIFHIQHMFSSLPTKQLCIKFMLLSVSLRMHFFMKELDGVTRIRPRT